MKRGRYDTAKQYLENSGSRAHVAYSCEFEKVVSFLLNGIEYAH